MRQLGWALVGGLVVAALWLYSLAQTDDAQKNGSTPRARSSQYPSASHSPSSRIQRPIPSPKLPSLPRLPSLQPPELPQIPSFSTDRGATQGTSTNRFGQPADS